jgi:hypothetical protein
VKGTGWRRRYLAIRYVRSLDSLFVDSTTSPARLMGPAMNPRTLWACHFVAFKFSPSVAPFGRRRRSRMIAFFDPSRASAAGLGAFFAFGCFLAVGFCAAALAFFFGLALLEPRLASGAPSEELVPLFPLLFFGAFWPGCAASVVVTASAAVSVMRDPPCSWRWFVVPSHDDSSLVWAQNASGWMAVANIYTLCSRRCTPVAEPAGDAGPVWAFSQLGVVQAHPCAFNTRCQFSSRITLTQPDEEYHELTKAALVSELTMFTRNSLFFCGQAVVLMLAFSSTSAAQATRTWVSAMGDDMNPCSRTAPCKTFRGAFAKVAPKGEINCIDPGGFGVLTITKPITIDCGFAPSILASATTGIIVDAGVSDTVTIRNLSINGAGGVGTDGITGISFLNGQRLQLENVKISNFTTAGIFVAAAGSRVTMANVTIMHCGTGLQLNPAGRASVFAEITGAKFWNNTNGVNASGATTNITIRDSSIAMNTFGILQSGGTGSGTILVIASQFTANGTAVQSNTASNISVFGNAFSQNGRVLNPNGGIIYSDGANVAAPGNGEVGFANGGVIQKI